jgi:hypothetical protein
MRATSRPIVFLVCLVLLLLMAARFFDHTYDDAFISFRYAENLVRGDGLVFNPGERVEGYSNFLWILLIAPFLALSSAPEAIVGLIGVAASIGLLLAVVRFSPECESMPELIWLAPLLVATSPPLAVWTTGGLETPLYVCLVVWAVGQGMQGVDGGKFPGAAAWVVAAAALTRPDGVGVAFALAAMLALLLRGRPGFAAAFARWCGSFLVVFLPFVAWRWFYYGDLLPNTFYAKIGSDTAQLARGLRYVRGFFESGGYWLLVPLIGLPWLGRDRKGLLLAGMTAALLAYPVLVGGDAAPMFRFMVPALPLLFLLLALAAAAAAERFKPGRTARLVVGLLALALVARAAWPAFQGEHARLVEIDRTEVAGWKEIGQYLGSIASPDESVAVITAGAIPYFSRLRAIDMLGLTDRTIARSEVHGVGRGFAGHEKHDVEYVLDRRPTYVVVGTYGLSPRPLRADELLRPFYAAERALLASPRFWEEYKLVRAQAAGGYFALFVRAENLS